LRNQAVEFEVGARILWDQSVMRFLISIVVSSFAVSNLLVAEEVKLPNRFGQSVVQISFEITPQQAEGNAYGGWDLFNGKSKQLWIGSNRVWSRGDLRKLAMS